MRSFVKPLFFASLILMAVAFWRRNGLPPPERVVAQVHEEPQQKAVAARPAEVTVNGVQHSIQPRYYELAGLVVALHEQGRIWQCPPVLD